MEVAVHYDNPDLAVFVQFDDASNTRVAYQEGNGLKSGRYFLLDSAIITAGLAQGSYNATVQVGDIDDTSINGDIRDIFSLDWSGSFLITGSSGGGVLSGRIGVVSLTPDEYLEIIQGEEKTITVIVEARGRFTTANPTSITVKVADGTITILKTEDDESIVRVTSELDVQVIRVTLSPDDTADLEDGIIKMEVAFDDQKCRIDHAVKVLPQIIDQGS